ncbi:hypothetical protein MPTK2_8g90030P [Marchantia polymorpha subsp. ruderalis]
MGSCRVHLHERKKVWILRSPAARKANESGRQASELTRVKSRVQRGTFFFGICVLNERYCSRPRTKNESDRSRSDCGYASGRLEDSAWILPAVPRIRSSDRSRSAGPRSCLPQRGLLLLGRVPVPCLRSDLRSARGRRAR